MPCSWLPLTALRANSNAMSSLQMGKQSYTRNFGYIYKRMEMLRDERVRAHTPSRYQTHVSNNALEEQIPLLHWRKSGREGSCQDLAEQGGWLDLQVLHLSICCVAHDTPERDEI